jgi:hypothetical protein
VNRVVTPLNMDRASLSSSSALSSSPIDHHDKWIQDPNLPDTTREARKAPDSSACILAAASQVGDVVFVVQIRDVLVVVTTPIQNVARGQAVRYFWWEPQYTSVFANSLTC